MERRLNKRDVIFIGCLLTIGLLAMLLFHLKNQTAGSEVVVTVDSKTYGTYSLDQDQVIAITVDGQVINTLTIQDGYVDMTDADCTDKLCVHQKAIHAVNETIVCLPNKVVVSITGGEESQFDSVAQ